ncbi:MAG TPA: hypothetical protein VG889_17950 [Rhizomicrobium sp.]|nr:hypothetical protein [Rhizomicrobium sp.]
MRGRILAAAALAVSVFATGAGAQQMGGIGGVGAREDDYGLSNHDMPHDVARPVSKDAVAVAQDLRLKGKCDVAVPILRRISMRDGSEISQLDLGLCLLDLASVEKDAKNAADMRVEAAQWIVRVADTGFAKAQAKAVALYLDAVGVAADPIEAEKWAILYHGNAMRFAVGLPDIAPDLAKRLDAALDDKARAQAEKRARAWAPVATASADE